MPEKIYGEKVANIAKVCHEVNRAYCKSIGDNTQNSWEDAEQWARDSACSGVSFHLDAPSTTPEESHAEWYRHKLADGWKYGPIKDPSKKEHPCMVPYDQLPIEQRTKDYLFKAVVETLKNIL